MTNPHFAGKTALVTGAGNGIGEASAQAFAAQGARVIAADIDSASAEKTVSLIKDAGGEATAIQCDATKEASVAALIKGALDTYGSLDFAHNNVGCGRNGGFEELTEEDYHWVSDITFKSVFLGMKHQVPAMRASGGGAIVNTASMAGVSTTLTADIVYAGSKAAVIHITAQAARRCAPDNIRVNCIAPGLVATKVIRDMFTEEQQVELASDQLFRRPIQPSEIAESVLFLCSERAQMITGIILPVDGGINAIR